MSNIPPDATVIDDSGQCAVYRLAGGRFLFVDESTGLPFDRAMQLFNRLALLVIFLALTTLFLSMVKKVSMQDLLFLIGITAVIAYVPVALYRKRVRREGRWTKQKSLIFETGSGRWLFKKYNPFHTAEDTRLEVVCEGEVNAAFDTLENHESQRYRHEWYYLYVRAGNRNYLLLRTKTYKKVRAVAALLEQAGMPPVEPRGFIPPTRD